MRFPGGMDGGHALGFTGGVSTTQVRMNEDTGVGPELRVCRKMLKIGSIYICYVRIHLKIPALMSYLTRVQSISRSTHVGLKYKGTIYI